MGNSIHRSSNVRDNNIELKKNIGKIKTLLHHIENNTNEMLKQKTKTMHKDYRDSKEVSVYDLLFKSKNIKVHIEPVCM